MFVLHLNMKLAEFRTMTRKNKDCVMGC